MGNNYGRERSRNWDLRESSYRRSFRESRSESESALKDLKASFNNFNDTLERQMVEALDAALGSSLDQLNSGFSEMVASEFMKAVANFDLDFDLWEDETQTHQGFMNTLERLVKFVDLIAPDVAKKVKGMLKVAQFPGDEDLIDDFNFRRYFKSQLNTYLS